jgi:uncharacterized lipoprotein YddW (UPF0748 family)
MNRVQKLMQTNRITRLITVQRVESTGDTPVKKTESWLLRHEIQTHTHTNIRGVWITKKALHIEVPKRGRTLRNTKE